ncbi:hypothetical protein KBB96_07810 [Luteolibacter ambystomatis]|uniref:Uncharacterized protein n=1 Tax=Luteolibacter ambystomatis TaxID=2824561 RepID=A0A975J2I3_9BACT|nr:hypothetical protein [Luteolibacter ambystomatis]QUE52787.1 hypothetical protein KBB96_07810 [Luteolibacter ambystomatis]
MKPLSFLLSALFAVALSGCVGGGIVRFKDDQYSSFRIGRKGQIAEDASGRNPSAGEILARWGQPDSKRPSHDGGEIWHYRGDEKEVDFLIASGKAVDAKVMKTGATGGYVGYMPGDSGVGARAWE